jgi:hypothetical protein
LDLKETFRRIQQRMLSEMEVAGVFEHPTAAGSAVEAEWLRVLGMYLPRRYRAAPAFAVDSEGRRSRQIDIAVFDDETFPPLFPHSAGIHIPAESVYAVFEVKPTLSRPWIRDAAEKAASVRELRRVLPPERGKRGTNRPILAGLLATGSVWTQSTFAQNLRQALVNEPLDIGCSLRDGAFEKQGPRRNSLVRVSAADEALMFFILRLLERLKKLGPAPAIDWGKYGRWDDERVRGR